MRKLLTMIAISATLGAAPASAASFLVSYGDSTTIPNNNDFKSNLGALGLQSYTALGATITLVGPGIVSFDFLGSESGYTNKFTSGLDSFVEHDANHFGSPMHMFTQTLAAGALNVSFNNQQAGAGNLTASPGQEPFGIFLSGLGSSSTTLRSFSGNTLYFGFDDQAGIPDDDNHDDFIIRATITAVPEPATWAMMLAGFGLVGLGVRRRSTRRRAVTA